MGGCSSLAGHRIQGSVAHHPFKEEFDNLVDAILEDVPSAVYGGGWLQEYGCGACDQSFCG